LFFTTMTFCFASARKCGTKGTSFGTPANFAISRQVIRKAPVVPVCPATLPMRYRRVVVSNKSMFNLDVSREFSGEPIGFSVHWLALLARANVPLMDLARERAATRRFMAFPEAQRIAPEQVRSNRDAAGWQRQSAPAELKPLGLAAHLPN